MRTRTGRASGATRATHTFAALFAALLLASSAGCAQNARAESVDAVVPVDLANFKITLPAHVRAGLIEFALTGVGPTMHEFNIARTDSSSAALPLAADGTVDDQTPHAGFQHIAEREGIDIGQHSSLVARLTPGHYVLYCNMYGHYQAGMHTELTVP